MIINNKAENGGGVYIDIYYRSYSPIYDSIYPPILHYGVFTIIKGIISSNEATYNGGGIYNNGSFSMHGGEVSENKAVSGGGLYNTRIYSNDGGAIENNYAAYVGENDIVSNIS